MFLVLNLQKFLVSQDLVLITQCLNLFYELFNSKALNPKIIGQVLDQNQGNMHTKP